MRKIKRFVLNDSFTVLSAETQKNVIGGGDTDPNVCHQKTTRDSCSGSCVDYAYNAGYCGWVGAYSQCVCVVLQPRY